MAAGPATLMALLMAVLALGLAGCQTDTYDSNGFPVHADAEGGTNQMGQVAPELKALLESQTNEIAKTA